MKLHSILFLLFFVGANQHLSAKSITGCKSCDFSSIQVAINNASENDTVLLQKGIFKEFNITIDKPLVLLGTKNTKIDAMGEGYGIIITADNVTLDQINITNIGQSYTKDFAAIYLSKVKNFKIIRSTLSNVFFGMLIEKSNDGIIENNHISGESTTEASSGNGIHMWNCSNVQIRNNELNGLRDGIYFEFVTKSVVTNNNSHHNLRYGLHFMFSNNDEYHHNTFKSNGAGVAVMFSKYIIMTNNTFTENWGAASYGLLLKEIYDAEIRDNIFNKNTIGVYAEGATRVVYEKNLFNQNGWAIKVSGACYTNTFTRNNFVNNSFDISYNSKVNDNTFDNNYWSSYTGYDLNRDGIGDIPYRPVKLFSYIVNRTPQTILLLRSLFMEILNFSEKVSPVFTPDNLMDNHPQVKRVK